MAEQNFPFTEGSVWLPEAVEYQPALKGDEKADVVVIGGGYTGLSNALHLKERGYDVAVLEQDFAGSGSSGRNAGHLTPAIGKDIPSLLQMFSEKRVKSLVTYADAAIEFTEGIMKKYDIDCDYEANGNIIGGVHPKHEEKLRKAAKIAREMGADVEFIDGNELRQKRVPASIKCGILEKRGGILHPGKYVMGLRQAAIAAGVRLYERSALKHMDKGQPIVAHTENGSITADKAVLATNAYTVNLKDQKQYVLPLRVTLFETEPLSDRQMDALGWFGREGIYTSHEVLENYRLTARNTIVGGSKIVRHAYGPKMAEGYHEKTFNGLQHAFNERFPEVAGLKIDRWWGGWIGLTMDFLPIFDRDKKHENLFYGLGYSGHGIPQATMMGAMLADRIEGKETEWGHALARRSFGLLPEPLMWLGGHALQGFFRAMDNRTDRQIRKLSAE